MIHLNMDVSKLYNIRKDSSMQLHKSSVRWAMHFPLCIYWAVAISNNLTIPRHAPNSALPPPPLLNLESLIKFMPRRQYAEHYLQPVRMQRL